MDAFGIFTRAPEGAEEESFDFQPLEGTWAMDGAKNPKSVLYIDDEGGWHLRERQERKANSKKWTAAPCARKAKAASKPSLTTTKASCTT